MPETPRLRHGNRNSQNLYLVNDDGSETFVGVAMTPEYAEMIIRRFNAATTAEADIRADERRKTAHEIARRIGSAPPFHWTRAQARTWAARIARQIGEGHDPR